MFNSYLKTTLRHLGQNRLFTVLNVLGLSIGISACWTIYRIVSYEFSFDKKQADSALIYRVVSLFSSEDKDSYNAGVPPAFYNVVKTKIPAVDKVVPINNRGIKNVQIPTSGTKENLSYDDSENLVNTTADYFNLVQYKWLAGNIETALDAPDKVVLTQSRANKYFPTLKAQDVLGRTLIYDDSLIYTVSGVVKDLDYPNSFQAKEFFLLPKEAAMSDRWDNVSSSNTLYLKLKQGVKPSAIAAQLNELSEEQVGEVMKQYNFKRWHELLPLSEVHFSTNFDEDIHKADKMVLYGLMGIGVFLLLLACINYINLSTAQIPQRSKEIGIRKTLGSSSSHLIGYFLSETLVIVLFAAVVSYFISELSLIFFKDFIPEGLALFFNYKVFALFLISLIIFVTIFSGIYPGWLSTRVQPVDIIKGDTTFRKGQGRLTLRKSLIIFQFIVAQIFIICTLIVGQQLSYTLKKDLGFNREAVILINVPWKLFIDSTYKNRQFVLKQELQNHPGIEAIALGDPPLRSGYNSTIMINQSDTGKVQSEIYLKNIDTAILALYQIKLLAGRNLHPSDTVREYVINETAVKAFGFKSPEDAIGKYLYKEYLQHVESTELKYPIVGVVKDFHTATFQQKINPLALMTDKSQMSTFNIKLNSTDPEKWQQVIKVIESKWKSYYPGQEFDYKFYDETLASLYKSERNMAKIINVATFVTIFISCLGLFGLAALTAFQRGKEIGIRKVLGASIASVVRLLSSDFIVLVLIAIIIASPIAWWLMNKWLQSFVYRIEVQWWMFAAAGILAVLIALVTVSFQAIKAAIVNPVDSLRDE